MNESYRHPGMSLPAAVLCAAAVGRSLCMRSKGHGGGHLPLPRHMPMQVGPWTVRVVREAS